MSVFLTASSPGLRTSPVKRGYWVVRRLLGEQIPRTAARRSRAAEGRSQIGRPDACRSFWPGIASPRVVQRATSDSTRSVWFSRAMARSANGASATWEAGRSRRSRHFPTAARGRVSTACELICPASRQDEFVDNLCRKLLVYALGRGLDALG